MKNSKFLNNNLFKILLKSKKLKMINIPTKNIELTKSIESIVD